MNRRQKKKQFKKRFGINPPRGISIKTTTRTRKTPPTVCGVAGIPNKGNNAAEAAGKRGNAN